MTDLRVSVVIPTRDYAHLLPAALRSVQKQTLEAWECIVVDDGSTDATTEVVDAFAREDRRFRAISQATSGPGAARNRGLREARGDYVQFLDADDLLHPDTLARHAGYLDTHPSVDLVIGRTTYFGDGDEPVRHLAEPDRLPGIERPDITDDPLAALLVENGFPIEAPLVRRSAIESAGLFDASLRLMEDWDLWLRLALRGSKFARAPFDGPVASIRVHSASASQHETDMLAAEIAIRRGLAERLAAPEAQALNLRRLGEREMELAVATALQGHAATATMAAARLAIQERRVGWLIWTLLMPIAVAAPGRRFLRRIRERRTSRAQKGV